MTSEEKDISAAVDWSELPEDLLRKIADRFISTLDLIHFRCTCKSWHSSAANKPFPCRPPIRLNGGSFLSRAAFYRVSLRLPHVRQGWLIKSELLESGNRRLLVCPISRFLTYHPSETLDLSEFEVSEVQECYAVSEGIKIFPEFRKVVAVTVVGETRLLGIDFVGIIHHWNANSWTSNVHQINSFIDIIAHGGLIYGIDTNGRVWRVNSSPSPKQHMIQIASRLEIHSSHVNFVESCGELYVVVRICMGETRKEQTSDDDDDDDEDDHPMVECGCQTMGFKVYTMNKETGAWMEIKSLGDRAFILATDCCFSVWAHEFYKCEGNSIYFMDELHRSALEGYDTRVFKLSDGSISKLQSSYTYFHMFSPTFMRKWGCWK